MVVFGNLALEFRRIKGQGCGNFRGNFRGIFRR